MKKLIFLFGFLLIPLIGFSYPRFAALTGDKCVDCHVNPDGGGMRNSMGIGGAKKFLKMDMFDKLAGKLEFSPKISENISVGGDLRLAHVDNIIPGQPNMNTFLQMQGDLYANVQINKILSAYITVGEQIPNFPVRYDVFGMISHLPLETFIKIGRFTPNYGIKVPEHRAFHREVLLNAPYSQQDGIEVGMTPGTIFNFTMGIFNGLRSNFFDAEPKKMFVASSDLTFSDKEHNFNFNFGGSFYNDPYTLRPQNAPEVNVVRQAYGGFAKIGIMKRVALLGELDFDRQITRDEFNSTIRGIIGFGELDIKVINGLELRGQYEYRDPDKDLSDDQYMRYSIGAAAFPFFGFETEIMLRFNKEAPSREVKNDEYQWTFHFYF
jgi:hypothetical protein